MAEVGRPMGPEERASRSLKHILNRCIKMAVRIDIGGVKKLVDGGLRDYVEKRMAGKSFGECVDVGCELMSSVRGGIAKRIDSSIADINRRATRLENILPQAEPIIKRLIEKGIADGSINEGEIRVVDAFMRSANGIVFGE